MDCVWKWAKHGKTTHCRFQLKHDQIISNWSMILDQPICFPNFSDKPPVHHGVYIWILHGLNHGIFSQGVVDMSMASWALVQNSSSSCRSSAAFLTKIMGWSTPPVITSWYSWYKPFPNAWFTALFYPHYSQMKDADLSDGCVWKWCVYHGIQPPSNGYMKIWKKCGNDDSDKHRNVEPVHTCSIFISVKIMWNVEKLKYSGNMSISSAPCSTILDDGGFQVSHSWWSW